MASEQKKLFVFGLATYLFTIFFVLLINSNFAGSRADSVFYLKMFQTVHFEDLLLPIEEYEVATSPIYITLIGILKYLFGTKFNFFIHFFYFLLSIGSLRLLIHLLKPINWKRSAPLVCLLSTSGYFVAPSIWPTSDTPTIFFSLLCVTTFLENKNKLFMISSFLLVSTRQNFAWLLIALLAFEFYLNLGQLKQKLFAPIKYFPAFGSLLFTFFYFENNLTPPMYAAVNDQNSFKLPNFLTTIQIGLSILSILGIFLLFQTWKWFKAEIVIKFRSKNLILAFIPFFYVFYGSEQKIGDGLGWISLLTNKIGFNIFFTTLFSSIGLILFTLFADPIKMRSKTLPTILFFSLIISSLVMQIPFLRYFEFSVVLIVCLLVGTSSNFLESLSKWKLNLLTLGVLFLNLIKILV